MASPGFDFQGAHDAGYSDAEIVSHLAGDKSFDVKGALDAGYSPSEIVSHLSGGKVGGPEKSTGFVDAFRQGAANAIGGVGSTLKEYAGPGPVGDTLSSVAAKIAPKNYAPADVVTKDGVSVGNIPRAVAEQAPGALAGIAAARMMPGPVWAKLLAGAGMYAAQSLGNRAEERAAARTGDATAAPTAGDKAVAAAAMVPEAAIGSLGLSRFLPGVSGAVTRVGAAGLKDAAGQLAKTVLAETATGAGQNVAAQAGTTVGTPGGISVDPTKVANAAVVQGATGGVLGGPKLLKDAGGAIKYRNFGDPANAEATTAVANRIKDAADGNLKSPEVGHQAVSDVTSDIKTELAGELRDFKKNNGNLTPEAANALKRAAQGKVLTADDHAAIDAAGQNIPNGDRVASLAKQASVLAQVKKTGTFSNGRFVGGTAGVMERKIRAVMNPVGAATAAGLGATVGGAGMAAMFSHAPAGLAAIGGAYGAARLADRFTGNRSPANRFAERFADPSVPVRPGVTEPPAPPVSRVGPTGPTIAPLATPWGAEPPAPTPETPRANGIVDQGIRQAVRQVANNKREDNRRTVAEAMPLLAQLAAKANPPAGIAPKPVATSPVGDVPRDVLANALRLTSALRKVNALKTKTTGANEADAAAAQSPFIEQTAGGTEALANPEAGKRMSQMVSAAKAIATLRSDPAADAAASAEEKAAKQSERDNVRAAKAQERVEKTKVAAEKTAAKAQEKADKTKALAERAIIKVTKSANGKIKEEAAPQPNGHAQEDAGYRPSSPYAHLAPADAARAFLNDKLLAGEVINSKTGFVAGAARNIGVIRKIAKAVANDTGLSAETIAREFEGAPTQTAAARHRETLKKEHPAAAAVLDRAFSDSEIARIWRTKG